jgi:hypothetical protein
VCAVSEGQEATVFVLDVHNSVVSSQVCGYADPEFSWPTRSLHCAKGHVDPVDDIKTLFEQICIEAEELSRYNVPDRWVYFREKALAHGLGEHSV